MALLMFPDPNQWPTVVSPCSVVAWQPGCDDKSFTLWFYGRLQKSVSIWPRVNHASRLFFKFQQIFFFFTSKWQILPDLCAEQAVIRYNLPAVVSNYEDNKLVILFPRPGCFFFFSHQLPLRTVLSSPFTSLYFLSLFCCWLAPFPCCWLSSPLSFSLSALTSSAKYLSNEYFLTGRGFHVLSLQHANIGKPLQDCTDAFKQVCRLFYSLTLTWQVWCF